MPVRLVQQINIGISRYHILTISNIHERVKWKA